MCDTDQIITATHRCFVTLIRYVWLPIPFKNFLIFTCASLPHCNGHSSGAPMAYRETSTHTVAARDVPLDPLGDNSTQPHAHKWGLVGAMLCAIAPTPVWCVCVCFLPIHSGHLVRWTYQQGSHRRKVTQDFPSIFFLRCVP